jgi:hypothetical protein
MSSRCVLSPADSQPRLTPAFQRLEDLVCLDPAPLFAMSTPVAMIAIDSPNYLQPNLLRAHAHAWSTPGAVGLAGS